MYKNILVPFLGFFPLNYITITLIIWPYDLMCEILILPDKKMSPLFFYATMRPSHASIDQVNLSISFKSYTHKINTQLLQV